VCIAGLPLVDKYHPVRSDQALNPLPFRPISSFFDVHGNPTTAAHPSLPDGMLPLSRQLHRALELYDDLVSGQAEPRVWLSAHAYTVRALPSTSITLFKGFTFIMIFSAGVLTIGRN
jgi:hypothetical protein